MVTSQNVKTEFKYHISLPTKEAHHKTHQTRGPHQILMAQRVNPQISHNSQEVQKALNYNVRTLLCTENPPDSDYRAYFPAILGDQ